MNRRWKYAGAAMLIVGITVAVSLPQRINTIQTPEKGQTKTYSLDAAYNGGTVPVTFTLTGEAYGEAEKMRILKEAGKKLLSLLPGTNESLSAVSSDLYFPEQVMRNDIQVSYQLNDYSGMNCFGELEENIPQEGLDIVITATLSFLDTLDTLQIPAHLIPAEKSEKQIMEEKVGQELASQSQENGEVILPAEYNGKKVTFYSSEGNPYLVLFGLCAIAVLYFYNDRVLKKRRLQEKRKLQMQCDYSDVVSKLTLLIGAGLSTSGALSRIASDYREKTELGSPKRYAYEEICVVCNRIGLGVPEEQAYIEFGGNCRIHVYLRLSSLLIQNMKKGNPGFFGILKNETTEAFMERKSAARCAGEVAGTKLLLPMGLQLLVVLVIIVVPAFMSF